MEGEASPLVGQQERRLGAGATRQTGDHQSLRRAGRCAQEWKPGAPPENVSKNMTFPNDGIDVVKMEYSESEISEVLAESAQARKHRQKLAKITETVAAYSLKEMKNLQAVEKLATWRRAYGYDRIAADDNLWASRPLPLTPEQFTQSLWSELIALRDAILMPEGDRFSQRAKSFIKGIGQGTANSTDAVGQSKANMTDEEFAILKRLVEKRDLEAAQVTITLVSTVHHCITRSPCPEISIGIRICMKSNEGKMDPEPTELESPSAGTVFETPGQQCPPKRETWETGRSIADGYFLVGIGSISGEDTSSPTERVGPRAGRTTTTTSAASNITFPQQEQDTQQREQAI